jgi:hypothetical protein
VTAYFWTLKARFSLKTNHREIIDRSEPNLFDEKESGQQCFAMRALSEYVSAGLGLRVKFYFLSVTPLPLPDTPFLHGIWVFWGVFCGPLRGKLIFRGFLGIAPRAEKWKKKRRSIVLARADTKRKEAIRIVNRIRSQYHNL